MRWPMFFMPLVLIAAVQWSPKYTPAYSLSLPPIAFMGFQIMLMVYPIFQNRYFGFKNVGLPCLDFLFVMPVSRRTLYFAKATIYLLASISLPLTFLVIAANEPGTWVKFPSVSIEAKNATRDFYLTQFTGATMAANADASKGSSVHLPHGQIAVATAWLVMTWAGVAFYQLVLGFFRRENALQFFLQLGLGLGMIFSLAFLNFSTSKSVSILAHAAAMISHFLLPIFLSLILATVLVQLFCAGRFAAREIQ